MQAQEMQRVWLRSEVLAASFCINLLGLALPITVLQVYDRVLRHNSVSTLTFLVLMTLGAFVLEFILSVARSQVLSSVSARYDHSLMLEGIKRILGADLEHFRSDPPDVHTERFRAIQRVRSFYAQRALPLLTDLPFAVLFLILITYIAGWLVLVPITVLALFGAVALSLSGRLAESYEQLDQSDTKRFNFLAEVLSQIYTVKALSNEAVFERRYERLKEPSAQWFGRVATLAGEAQSAGQVFAQIATVATVAGGAYFVVQGSLTIGSLAAVTILTGRLLQPVMRGLSAWTQYQSIRLAEKKIATLMKLPPAKVGSASINRSQAGILRFESVDFAYPNSNQPLLHGVSFEVPKGAFVAITGPTASGKTTLLQLIAGLYPPTSGQITLGGEPISSFDPRAYRHLVSLLPSKPTTYRGTLLENLTGFEDGSIRDRTLSLTRTLGLDNFIASLSQGLDTPIGAGNSPIPSGFAQRITLIRAFAWDPQIILFDDANASLDQDSDKALLNFLTRLKGLRTVVLVSSRPSYLALCSKIYALNNGSLIDTGRAKPTPKVKPRLASRLAPPAASAGAS